VTDPSIVHSAVLRVSIQEYLSYAANAVVVDATVGQAGHALDLASSLGEEGLLIGLDVDTCGLAVARRRLEGLRCRVELRRENFRDLDKVLEELDLEHVDVILADLGANSAQLDDRERGFSFQVDGPLDMRLDDRQRQTAQELVNRLPEKKLADLIWRYSDERHSRRIARAIVSARRIKPLERTEELVSVINQALGLRGGGRRSKIHPATRTFQALRIAVNDELGSLDRLLELGPQLLKTGGQIAIISFHSLEDRRVKHNFRGNAKAELYEELTRKPITADEEERMSNPRSRSAKLRIARRVVSGEW
jgi:16S rRNA (cytosine1402-N4)-methyltransferase